MKEPGELADLTLGVPGPAVPLPEDDADRHELVLVNNYDDDEEDDTDG